jgi:hypothetical protein
MRLIIFCGLMVVFVGGWCSMENPGLKIQPAIVQPMTKLIMPSIPASHLRRPRLNQRCQDMMKHKIILVTAPAGYGKTTFLSEALADMGHLPVAGSHWTKEMIPYSGFGPT